MNANVRGPPTTMVLFGAVIVLGIVLGAAKVAATSSAPEHATLGRIPDAALLQDGGIDTKLVPDYVAVWNREGTAIAGYVAKDVLLGANEPTITTRAEASRIPVYADDLATIVGYMVPDKGFVQPGVNPDLLPAIPGVGSESK
jgi:hypothetical protein